MRSGVRGQCDGLSTGGGASGATFIIDDKTRLLLGDYTGHGGHQHALTDWWGALFDGLYFSSKVGYIQDALHLFWGNAQWLALVQAGGHLQNGCRRAAVGLRRTVSTSRRYLFSGWLCSLPPSLFLTPTERGRACGPEDACMHAQLDDVNSGFW